MMSNHTKTIGGVAALLFMGSVILFLALAYLVIDGESKLALKLQEADQRDAHEKELVSLIGLVEESELEREALHRYVLMDEEVIDFLALIETLGKEQGVTLRTSSLNEVNVGEAFTTLEIVTSISGQFASIQHLLALFETMPYQSLVTNLTLSRDPSVSGMWSGTLYLRVTKFSKQ